MQPGAPAPHPRRQRHLLDPIAAPFVALCLSLRVPPIAITLLSLPLAVAAALTLARGMYWPALFLVFLAAGADRVDGEIARRTGRTSPAGGYLDSMADRYVDALVIIGLAWGIDETRAWVAAFAALFGVLTTSAAKWRVSEDTHLDPGAWGRDLLERTGRYVVLLAGILLTALVAPLGHEADAVFGVLVVLAVLSNLTVAQRTIKGWRILKRTGG